MSFGTYIIEVKIYFFDCVLTDTPRCRVGKETQRIYALRHTSVVLRCFVDADPTFGVRFGWTHNATSRAVNAIPAYRIQLSSNDSLASILHYTIEDERDYGTLGCWATNSVGRQAKPCYFHVLPASKLMEIPSQPRDQSYHSLLSRKWINIVQLILVARWSKQWQEFTKHKVSQGIPNTITQLKYLAETIILFIKLVTWTHIFIYTSHVNK